MDGKFFPGNYIEALAILYIQNQDLKGKSPAEIHEMYWRAYYDIAKDHREKKDAGWFKALEFGL